MHASVRGNDDSMRVMHSVRQMCRQLAFLSSAPRFLVLNCSASAPTRPREYVWKHQNTDKFW